MAYVAGGRRAQILGLSTVQGKNKRTQEGFMSARSTINSLPLYLWSLSQSTNTSGVLQAIDCHLLDLVRPLSILVMEILRELERMPPSH